jgi:hypothetical protein
VINLSDFFQNRNYGRKEMQPDISNLKGENYELKAKLKEAINIITFYSQEYDNGLRAKEFLSSNNANCAN